jgi:hypothetical protein
MLIKLIQSNRKNKRYTALFSNGKKIHFGDIRYDNFTIHKDEARRDLYIKRHSKEDWRDPYKAGTLARYLLWEYKDLNNAIKKYNEKFF